MKKAWFLAIILAAALCVSGTRADAENGTSGVYVSLSGAFVIPNDSNIVVNYEGSELKDYGEVSFENGFGGMGAVGYEFGSGIRAEMEVGYRIIKYEEIRSSALHFLGVNEVEYKGDADTLSFMANAYYVLRGKTLRPYVGGGIGIAKHSAKDKEIGGYTISELETVLGDLDEEADDTVFAYQAMAGLGIGVMENLEARLGYRFFASATPDFDGTEASYHTHNIEVGLLYRF